MTRTIPEFVPNQPTTGDVIRSAHVRNIENYLDQLIEINGATGITTITVASGLAVSGNAVSGITIWTTGSVTTPSALSFPHLETNFYPNLTYKHFFTTDYELNGVYITGDNAPSGNILIDVYKNDSVILSGAVLSTGNVVDEAITGVTLSKGDKIKFTVTSVADLTAGNSVYFGVY